MNEVQFQTGAPPCPAWLGREAKVEWRRVAKQLAHAGLVQRVDLAALAANCEAWGEFVQLRADVDALRAAAADNPSGRTAESVLKLVRLKNAAAERAVRMAAQFGFTPAARARITAPPPPDEPDEFDRFLQRHRRGSVSEFARRRESD
jgi:P27 family predicted phage terminase small subunit